MLKPSVSDNFALVQALAIVTMALDHLGALGLLGEWSRLLGRFALPAFVVMVVYNALRATSPWSMFRRCVLILLLAQPFWWLTVGSWDRLCIMAPLALMVLLVIAWRSRPHPFAFVSFVALLCLYLAASPWFEGGPWPLLLLFYLLAPGVPTALLALLWPLGQYLPQPVYLLPAYLSLVLLYLLPRLPASPRLPRLVTRWFYPAHLAFLLPFVT